MDDDDWRGQAPKPGAPHKPDASASPDTHGARGFPPERQMQYPVAGGAVPAADRAAADEEAAAEGHDPLGPAGFVEPRDLTGGPARALFERTADPTHAPELPGDLVLEGPEAGPYLTATPPRSTEEELGPEPEEPPPADPLGSRWVRPFDRTLARTRDWMRDVALALDTTDPRDARHALGAVLPTLRDQLPVAEIADLAANLPLPIRGLLLEGWTGHPERVDTRAAFVRAVERRLGPRARLDPTTAVDAVVAVLERRIPVGERADLAAVLPLALKALVAPR